MSERGTLRLKSLAGGLEFEASFPAGQFAFDSGPQPVAPNPMHALLAALAACEAMDVISILRKKQQPVSAYEVDMSGERAAEHPRRYLAIELVHRLRGPVSPAAIEEAIRLSEEKYFSVYHSLRPDLTIRSRYEIQPDD